MANVSVQLKRIDTQANAAADNVTVLLDGQPIRVQDTGHIYWGHDGFTLADLVTEGFYTIDVRDLVTFLEDGDIVSSLTFQQGGLRLKATAPSTFVASMTYDEVATGNRILNLNLNDANRRLTISADADISGTNTGDQDLSPYQTIAALAADVRAVVLTGLSLASSAAVSATDTILSAFGKLQAFNDLFTTVGLAIARLTNPSAVTFLRMNADNTATARTAAEMRTDLGVPANAEAILKTFVAAKGDIIGASANDTPTITTVGTDGQILMANSANASGLGYGYKPFAIRLQASSLTLTNIPAAIDWIGGGAANVRQQLFPLAGYTQVRIMAFVTTLFAGAGSGICLRYRSAYSATASDYAELGTGATEVLSPISAANWNDSGWITITAAALADVYVGVFTINGNGTSDPVITQVIMYLR